MAELDKVEIRSKIEAEIRKTKDHLSDYKELTRPVAPENAIGRVSRMDAIQNKSVMEAAMRKAELKLEKLQGALNRLDEADFGVCVRCHQPIPLGRILLVPQAKSCVKCSF